MKKNTEKATSAPKTAKGAFKSLATKTIIAASGIVMATGCIAGEAKAFNTQDATLKAVTSLAEQAKDKKTSWLEKITNTGIAVAKDALISRAKEEKAKNFESIDTGFKLSWNLNGKGFRKPDTVEWAVAGIGSVQFAKKTKQQQDPMELPAPLKTLSPQEEANIKTQADMVINQVRGTYIEPEGPTQKEIIEDNIIKNHYKVLDVLEEDIMEKKMGIETDAWAGNCKKAAENPDLVCDFLAEHSIPVSDYGKKALANGEIKVFLNDIMNQDEEKNGERRSLDEILEVIPDHKEDVAETEAEEDKTLSPEIIKAIQSGKTMG